MVALVSQLDRWASAQRRAADCAEYENVVVVFEQPPASPIRSSIIEVTHAPKAAANSADDKIVRLVGGDTQPSNVRVVTSDKALSDRVLKLGASVYPAESFRTLIDPGGDKSRKAPG